MKSIRKQLIFTLLSCLTLLFAAASATLYLYARGALLNQFDESLRTKILSFAEMIEVEEKEGEIVFEIEFSEFPLPEFRPSSEAAYYEVRRRDGSIVARSPSLGGQELERIEAGRKLRFSGISCCPTAGMEERPLCGFAPVPTPKAMRRL